MYWVRFVLFAEFWGELSATQATQSQDTHICQHNAIKYEYTRSLAPHKLCSSPSPRQRCPRINAHTRTRASARTHTTGTTRSRPPNFTEPDTERHPNRIARTASKRGRRMSRCRCGGGCNGGNGDDGTLPKPPHSTPASYGELAGWPRE